MSDDALDTANDVADVTASAKKAAKAAVANAMDAGQARLNDAIDTAEKNLNDAAKRVEKALREGLDTLKTQSAPYRDNAGAQIDEASQYVIERVKERPVTATLAGLGVGLLLGLLLASRSSK
ncbi:MAG TPA: hypothetical protein VGL58_11445 [Caulobacteraceae bacterium]